MRRIIISFSDTNLHRSLSSKRRILTSWTIQNILKIYWRKYSVRIKHQWNIIIHLWRSSMIRLFIFVLVRFFIIALVIYFVLTLLKRIIQTLIGHSHLSPPNPRQEKQQKPKEDYKDVKDAKFVELPNKQTKDKHDSPIWIVYPQFIISFEQVWLVNYILQTF